MKKTLLLALLSSAMFAAVAQNKTISGKVTDNNGKALPGVTITIQGQNLGSQTGDDGSFKIKLPNGAKSLVFSTIGFTSQTVSIGNKTDLQVFLAPASSNLNEVVVVGYGTQKKSNITSAIARVGGEKVENVPFASIDQTLQGKVAGLQSSSNNGQPGASQDVRIRGIGSFGASANPLYVVDGVQINSGDVSGLQTTSNVLSTLNPNDIEDISVLKDAAATAIYGSRGANGVILITTKKGKAGKTQFRFDTEVGQSKYADIPDPGRPISAKNWFALLQEGMVNAGFTPTRINNTLASYGYNNGVDIDWIKLTTQTGSQQQYNLSMSGGDAKTQIYLSGGLFKQQGSNIGSSLQRVSGNIKLTHTISPKLSVSTNLTIGHVYQNSPSSGPGSFANPYYVSLTLRPTQNPFNPDGTFNIGSNNLSFPTHFNPLYIAANDKIWLKNLQVLAGGSLEYKILSGLKFTSHVGVQYNNLEEFIFNNPFHGDGVANGGLSYNYYTRYFLWDWYNQLDYHWDILNNSKLTADVKVGYEAIKNNYYREAASSQNYPPTVELPYSVNAATALIGNASAADYSFASVYSSASFNYLSKYSLYFSYRRDGSSRFGLNNQYGNFPAVGIAWNANEENFLKKSRVVSLLKLRGSYGSTGNAGIGDYQWRQTYGYGFNYNGNAGGTFNSIGNVDLTWEKTNQADVGIDLGVFKNRITITADYYRKVSDGLLFPKPISLTTGFGSITSNIGKIENKGLELNIGARVLQLNGFYWDMGINISHNVNKVLSLPGHQDIANGAFQLSEGRDIQSFYQRALAGVDPATGSEMWYTDATRKTTTASYAAASLQFLNKSASPSYFGSFSNTFNFKGFYLTADFYYDYGNYVQDLYSQYFLNAQLPTRGKYTINLTRWQKPGDITTIPKYVYGQPNNSGGERSIYKGDYIRLRNIVVGYRISSKFVLDKLHINSLNFYVRGTNLWTKLYDNRLPFDPEQGVTGQDAEGLLVSKSVTVGLNVTF